MNNNPTSTPQTYSEENKKEISLQTLRVIGLIVLISDYTIVTLSEVGELKNLLTNPNANNDLFQEAVF
ncbi:hypothetical protein [Bacillus pseudomycoides]|uniref:hypothetical protein n=1 Tax=Bacillus pseudomycoides TaxID=64104 RepID=UPI000BEB8E7C|nr:hypothetical protein [Bacillus pseudomycoides]PEE44087.1 hypothetical protein COO02_04375 [Bacillus pseudomycoides]PGA86022.1 hypothetical protein COL91_24275 [Bacillus pseudomycoides]PHF49353.1 hypothetical protein COF72_07890 [Bacillus pseudomycoides]